MKFRFGLRLKFIILFIVFSLTISVAIVLFAKFSFRESITEKYRENAISIAKLAESILDGDQIKEYATNREETSDYLFQLAELNNIKIQTDTYFLYVMMPIDEANGIYIFDTKLTEQQMRDLNSSAAKLGDPVEFEDDFGSAFQAMATKEPSRDFEITVTNQGNANLALASTYAPIIDSNGDAVAFVGVDVMVQDIDTYVNESTYNMVMFFIATVILCMIVLIIIVQSSVIAPVKVLKRFVEDMAEGKLGRQINVKGRDEISEISHVFNRMSKNIEGHVSEIHQLNDAYYKFVPSKIFQLLDKTTVTDVTLGSQTNVDLTVMIYNIVGFQEAIRKMQSKEMFTFINESLTKVIPFVIEEEGVIETFKDAGFSAFYVNGVERSLMSAISISHAFNVMAAQKTEEIYKIGIGITHGPVMLGIVGHDKRLSTLSISQQTRTAEFLQAICPKYSSRIIITARGASRIEAFDKKYHVRFLGFIYSNASESYEKIYDVFDGDEEGVRSSKLRTKQLFEEGVNLYCAKRFYDARMAFVEVIKQNRQDNAAREYLYLCNRYYQLETLNNVDIAIERY